MNKLKKTDIKNLYYQKNKLNKKVYIAIFYKEKRRYKKSLGTNYKQALIDLKAFEIQIKNKLSYKSFKSVFDEYMEILGILNSKKEYNTKLSRYKKHLAVLAKKDINDIKFSDLQEIINNAIYVNDLSPKTAKNKKALLAVVFNFANKQNYTYNNPANLIQIPKFDNKQNIKITLSQARSLINNILICDNEVVRDICILGFHGRRLGEILNMQWYQICLETRTYQLPYQKNKAKKNMTFKMTNLLFNAFTNRLAFAKTFKKDNSDDYVFLNTNTLNKYSDISVTFKKIKKKSNINPSDFRFHDFRHLVGTFGINLLDIPVAKVSHTLGHTNITTTQIYITKSSDSSKEVMDKLIDLLSSGANNE
jgi:integrase